MTTMELNVSRSARSRVTSMRCRSPTAWSATRGPKAAMFAAPRSSSRAGSAGGADHDSAHLRDLRRQPRPGACYALDTAWGPTCPEHATRVRNIRQACEDAAEHPALVLRDHGARTSPRRSTRFPSYEEVARQFAPYVGTSYQTGVTLSQHPVRSTLRSSAGSGHTRRS